MTIKEKPDGTLLFPDFNKLQFSPKFAADSLGISQQTLKLMERDHGLVVARRTAGSVPVRVYSVSNLFEVARIRREKGLTKGLARQVIMSTFVQKGGTAKTTTSINLAISLAFAGLKVLIIDNDPQGDSTAMVGYDPDLSAAELAEEGAPEGRDVDGHLGHLLDVKSTFHSKTLNDVLKKPFGEHGPHLIPAEESLEDLDVALRSATKPDFRYALFFDRAKKGKIPGVDLSMYDVIIIDNAPSSSLLTHNSMVASDFLICPVRMDRFSLRALNRLSGKVEGFEEDFDRRPEIFVIPTMYIKNRPRIQHNIAKLNDAFPGKVSEIPLYFSEDYSKSLDDAIPIMLWKGASDNSIGAMRSVFTTMLDKVRAIIGSA